MPQYDMGINPETWPKPDEVDVIQAAERWEATEDYEDAALTWGVNDADLVAEIKDRFATSAAYDREFAIWLDRQLP